MLDGGQLGLQESELLQGFLEVFDWKIVTQLLDFMDLCIEVRNRGIVSIYFDLCILGLFSKNRKRILAIRKLFRGVFSPVISCVEADFQSLDALSKFLKVALMLGASS